MRLFRSEPSSSEPHFPGRLTLPAWLLSTTWLTFSNESGGIPDGLHKAILTMPAGSDAAVRIMQTLTASNSKTADAFARSMPPDWREKLDEAGLRGTASVHPLQAARQAVHAAEIDPTKRPLLHQIALTAAQNGPIEESLQLLTDHKNEIDQSSVTTALALLYARNPAAVSRFIDAKGLEPLKEALAVITNQPAPDAHIGRPLVAVLTEINLAHLKNCAKIC